MFIIADRLKSKSDYDSVWIKLFWMLSITQKGLKEPPISERYSDKRSNDRYGNYRVHFYRLWSVCGTRRRPGCIFSGRCGCLSDRAASSNRGGPCSRLIRNGTGCIQWTDCDRRNNPAGAGRRGTEICCCRANPGPSRASQ